MSTYEGIRYEDGAVIHVDGRRLRHVVRHSPTGLEWGYGGSGPSDTALSILTHHFGDRKEAERYYMAFKHDVVAGFPNVWTLTSKDIDIWLAGEVARRREKGHV